MKKKLTGYFYKLFIFFKDIKIAKNNQFYTGEEGSYTVLRFLYLISDGFFLKFLELYLFFSKKYFYNIFSSKLSFETLPKIDEKTIYKLRKELMSIETYSKGKKFPLKFKNNNTQELHFLDFEYYSKNKIVRLDFDRNQIMQNKFLTHFIKDTLSPQLIEVIKKFFGFSPHLGGIHSWITLPVPRENAKLQENNYELMTNFYDAQQWHRDCDNLRDIKLFIYLSDVNSEEDGCFQIINGTNNFSFFSPLNYKTLSGLRVDNNYVAKKFNSKIHSFYGAKGTNFLADTRALHRGLAIKKLKARFMLEIYFTNHSFGKNTKLSNLQKKHDSYELWQEMIEKKSELYSGVFLNKKR